MTGDIFIHLSVNATRANRDSWGDTQFAEGLARAIREIPGCDAGLLFRGESPPTVGRPASILRIAGPHLEDVLPGIPNMLWLISPPNHAPTAMIARYQAVFSGAEALARRLGALGIASEFLPQASDTAHFHPSRRPQGAADIPLVFVGRYAPRVDRRLVLECVQAGFAPQIWGPGWKGVIPDQLWQGERLDYDELVQVYTRARVILNSHMTNMARLGFMSNRSYDALASGALVVSDTVAGFSDADLPEIRQVRNRAGLCAVLEQILAAPALTLAERIALHDRLAARHSFGARAALVVATARNLLDSGRVAQAAFQLNRKANPLPPKPAEPASTSGEAAKLAAEEVLAICSQLEQGQDLSPDPSQGKQRGGIIHALMPDLREVREIAALPAAARPNARLEDLAARARRVAETLVQPDGNPLALHLAEKDVDRLLLRLLANEPLWAFQPDGFLRDGGKVSLPLWPRKQQASPASVPAVFLHLYYDELAPTFAERLAHIECPFSLYVSTDSEAKAARIRSFLPNAEIRVFENRGRDIWPKLYGFADVYDRHEVVLHLHGKKSLHSDRLDDWLDHILGCLLGSPGEVSRILSFFDTIPHLGMIVPVTFRGILGAAHWGANREIARELAYRMKLDEPLPENNALRFPVGSMFWARTAAIRPVLDLRLRPEQFPPEAGQVDGTVAHALERMLGVTCKASGYHILPVAGMNANLHTKHQRPFKTNGALRAALEAGEFDG